MAKTLLVILLGHAILLAGFPTSADEGDREGVLTQIRQIVKDESQNCERLLARAWPIADEAFKDKEWGKIEKALKAAGLSPAWGDGRGAYSEYRCAVMPGACTTPQGSKLELYLSLSVSGGRSQPTYAVPPDYTVTSVTVGLSATVLAPAEQVRREKWFGEETIIQEALAEWPVSAALPDFPVLETVDLSFGELSDTDAEEETRHYRLQLLLVKAKDKRQVRRRLGCIADAPRADGQGRGHVRDWLSLDFAPSDATTLARNLRRLLDEKESSYQLILWKATHVVQKAALDREWPVVSKELGGQNLKLVSEQPWQYGTNRQYMVAEKAHTTAGGQTMDLFVYFSTFRRTSKTAPTRDVVYSAYAGFSANVQATCEQVLSDARFGKDTAIHKALLHDDAKEAVQKYPWLKSVEVYYDVIADRWLRENSWGFFVQPEFAGGEDDAAASASLLLSISSELDPLYRGGSTVLVKDFVPSDTLGEPICHGRSYSSGRSEDGQPSTFFLTKKGQPRWRNTGQDEPKSVVVYGLGDLKTLPPNTPAITLENQEVYDDDLAALARFTDLQSLDLGACEGITDRGLEHLVELKKLFSLTLSGERISGTGFQHLHGLPALTGLEIQSSKQLTNDGIAALSMTKQLTRLSLRWGELTDNQIAELTKLAALRELDIWGSREITDDGLKRVSLLASLQELTFSHSRGITPSGIAHLTNLKNLREISVGYMPLRDDAMQQLSRVQSLEYVEMQGLEVTGQGIRTLSNLTHLKRLYLHGCKGVATEDLNTLKSSLEGEFVLEAY